MSTKYPNIPGVNMELNDGQLTLNTSINTPRVLIIDTVPGDNESVPEEPVLISNTNELKENFGGFFIDGKPNKLALEWKATQDIASTRTYLMALKGETTKDKYINLHNQLFGYMADFAVEHVVLTGLYADEYVEGLKAEDFLLAEDQDAFPAVKGVLRMGNVLTATGKVEAAVFPLTVETDKYDTLKIKDVTADKEYIVTIENKVYLDFEELFAEIVEQIHSNVELEDYVVSNDNDVFQIVSENELITLANGTSPLSRILKVTNQQSIFKENDAGTKIVGSPAHLIATYVEEQSLQFNNTIGYMGITPVTGTSLREKQEYVNKLIRRDNDVSKFLQVLAGPETGVTVEGSLRTQWTSGVAHYAGLVSTLAPEIATTNQELATVNRLRYAFSLRQVDSLIAKKYVVYRIKNSQIVVSDGVTTAPDLYIGQDLVSSDFTRLSTLRITNHMITQVRNAVEPFIGKPHDFRMYNAMNTAVKSCIQANIESGVIQDAKYAISLGASLDRSTIKLQLLPQFELRVIDVEVGLTNPTNFAAGTTP